MATYKPSTLTANHPQVVENNSGYKPFRNIPYAAPYLPILEVDTDKSGTINIPIVIKAGMLIGIDPWGYIVPATGYYASGSGVTMTYTATDVTYGVIDLDTMSTTTTTTTGAALKAHYYGTAVAAAGKSSNTICVWPIGIAENDYYINPFVWRALYTNFNLSQAQAPVTAGVFEVPLVKAATLIEGDYIVPDNPTDDTFSAANVANMGRPVSYSTYLASLTVSDVATMKSVAGRLTGMIVGKTVEVIRIDNLNYSADMISTAPGFSFGSFSSTGSAITDYTNAHPHLTSAAELARSINGTSVTGRWAAKLLIGPSVGR